MTTITVVVGDAPYGKQRLYTALRFLLEDAVFAAKKGQQPPAMPIGDVGMPNCEELLRAAVLEGLTIKACRVCSSERALQPDELMAGVDIGSMLDLVNWVVESDRTLFF